MASLTSRIGHNEACSETRSQRIACRHDLKKWELSTTQQSVSAVDAVEHEREEGLP